MKLAVILSFFLAHLSQTRRITRQLSEGEKCRTPLGDAGECRGLSSCAVLQDLVRQGDSATQTLLKDSRCGFDTLEPLYCCPELNPPQSSWEQRPTTRRPTQATQYGSDTSLLYENSGENRFTTQRTTKSTRRQTTSDTISFMDPDDVRDRVTTRRTTSRPTRGQTRDPYDQERESVTRRPSGTNSTGGGSAQEQCGTSGGSADRIVGGDSAALGAWPWITALGYRSPSRSGVQWLCGGALVSDRHVITAAHCVVTSQDKTLSVVRLGELDLEEGIDDGATPVDMEVQSAIPHSNYKSSEKVNDIAVVKMKGRVQFTGLIQPICLPNSARLGSLVGKAPYVAGWGALLFRGPTSNALQQVDVTVASEESCRAAYRSQRRAVIDERVICAGSAGKDACQGDSGGPLMFEQGNKFYLIGVVSYGKDCATPEFPGVYTRVTSFMDWINRNLN